MLERDNFSSAEVKRLIPTPYFRAKLDYSNRLIFQIRKHAGKRYALLLEVVRNHAYEKSRFLRGAGVSEDKVSSLTVEQELEQVDALSIPYVNESSKTFFFLDKALSFDEVQSKIFKLKAPLIVIGSAGSGKTALVLEKTKQVKGSILYTTLSPFLAKNARDLYYANHYENENQEIDFLSFREFLETIQVPAGKEIDFAIFRGWFASHQPFFKFTDAHKLFEEFKGVLTGGLGGDSPYLSRDQYMSLGVKQSIFLQDNRVKAYDLFEKYLNFLRSGTIYDPNIVSHSYLNQCKAQYDFVVIDEVQDLTQVQLSLIMRSLKAKGNFLLCGDSNQIVHPNFFSWSKVKTLFFKESAISSEDKQTQLSGNLIQILTTNFRNSNEITRISNALLKIKQRQFGSIDKESNYLITSNSGQEGRVELFSDTDATKKNLDDKVNKSTKFAILVMREDQKLEARRWFKSPLLFSVQEAKGLEYENVILFNFVSSNRASFSKICEGISSVDIKDELSYSRGKDKTDKSSEVYKFFINSLYVAITRAVKNLYLIESDLGHELFKLLDLHEQLNTNILVQNSSLEEWQQEARKLEAQGKKEQAAEIRSEILQSKAVPWRVLDPKNFTETLSQGMDPKNVSRKPRELILEYGAFYEDTVLGAMLTRVRFDKGEKILQFTPTVKKKYLDPYGSKNALEVLSQVDLYGPDFRNTLNLTPLMCAVRAGNIPLTRVLLAKGANPEWVDNYGQTAFHHLLECATQPAYARINLSPFYSLLKPSSVSVQIQGRLVKLDARTIEYLLFNVMLALMHERISKSSLHPFFFGFNSDDLLQYLSLFPNDIVNDQRRRRAYLSAALSRNEVSRAYAYNRRIFLRVRTGTYILNPKLMVQNGDTWIKLHDYLGFSQMKLHSSLNLKFYLERLDYRELMQSQSRVAIDSSEVSKTVPSQENL